MSHRVNLFLDACALIYRFEGAAEFRDAAALRVAQLTQGNSDVRSAVASITQRSSDDQEIVAQQGWVAH